MIDEVLELLALRRSSKTGINAEDNAGNTYKIKSRIVPPNATAFDISPQECKSEFNFLLGVIRDKNKSILKIIKVTHKNVKKYFRPHGLRWAKKVPYPFEIVWSRQHAYLMAWNPSKWHWHNLPQIVSKIANGRTHSVRWRTANRNVQKGDRIFFVHLGDAPRGIFASGIATGPPVYEADTSVDLRSRWYVPIEIRNILNPANTTILDIKELKAHVSESFPWTPQSSGIQIPPREVQKLELLWQSYVKSYDGSDLLINLQNQIETLVETENVRRSGQGFNVTPELRRKIEAFAMSKATEYFGKDYDVKDVSRTKPYDLECWRGQHMLRVEVKGTQSVGSSVILTFNEVENAKINTCALFVVHSIKCVKSEDTVIPESGELMILNPWQIDLHGSLKPISFIYEIKTR